MNFFGEYTVHDYPTDKDLWVLHNPVSSDLFGAMTDDSMPIVPCDNFVYNMSSSGIARPMWPSHWARKSSCIHDWGFHCHKTSVEELMAEMKAWFNSMNWDDDQRLKYIHWIKSRTLKEWNRDFYVLTEYEGIWYPARITAYRLLQMLSWIPWNSKRTDKTKTYRESCNKEAAFRAMEYNA